MSQRIDELTRKEILKDVQSKVKRRSKDIDIPTYIGITPDFIVHMKVPSSTGVGDYVVKIKLSEYGDIAQDSSLTTREKVRLSLAGDISIHCTCPAFKWWGYEYIMTQLDSNAGNQQDIYPKIRNPKLEGTLCKHCYRAIKMFGKYWSLIASDIQNGRFLEVL